VSATVRRIEAIHRRVFLICLFAPDISDACFDPGAGLLFDNVSGSREPVKRLDSSFNVTARDFATPFRWKVSDSMP
jgi:hypothetical protein